MFLHYGVLNFLIRFFKFWLLESSSGFHTHFKMEFSVGTRTLMGIALICIIVIFTCLLFVSGQSSGCTHDIFHRYKSLYLIFTSRCPLSILSLSGPFPPSVSLLLSGWFPVPSVFFFYWCNSILPYNGIYTTFSLTICLLNCLLNNIKLSNPWIWDSYIFKGLHVVIFASTWMRSCDIFPASPGQP